MKRPSNWVLRTAVEPLALGLARLPAVGDPWRSAAKRNLHQSGFGLATVGTMCTETTQKD